MNGGSAWLTPPPLQAPLFELCKVEGEQASEVRRARRLCPPSTDRRTHAQTGRQAGGRTDTGAPRPALRCERVQPRRRSWRTTFPCRCCRLPQGWTRGAASRSNLPPKG